LKFDYWRQQVLFHPSPEMKWLIAETIFKNSTNKFSLPLRFAELSANISNINFIRELRLGEKVAAEGRKKRHLPGSGWRRAEGWRGRSETAI